MLFRLWKNVTMRNFVGVVKPKTYEDDFGTCFLSSICFHITTLNPFSGMVVNADSRQSDLKFARACVIAFSCMLHCRNKNYVAFLNLFLNPKPHAFLIIFAGVMSAVHFIGCLQFPSLLFQGTLLLSYIFCAFVAYICVHALVLHLL